MRRFKGMAMTVMMGGVIAVAAGCGSDDTKTSSGEGKGSGQLQGEVITDGSSTVLSDHGGSCRRIYGYTA
ncbi:hypothetical protein [Peribacillus sp. 1P06PB]|uniref:hypothetical protein n=1 Tax=Peribacillus sp. 1P06PB TaxID=3132296 RepID=UPI00399F4BE3